MRVRTALTAAALAATASLLSVGAPPAGAAAPPGPDLSRLCERLERTPAKAPLCTHGPDRLEALGGLAELQTPPAAATPAALADLCSDGGVSGRRVEVLYGVPSDRVNRYVDMLPTMRAVLAAADQALDASDTDTEQHYRFLCENGTDVTIRNVTLLPIGSDGSFTYSDYANSLQSQVELGLGPVNYLARNRVYMTFVDQITSAYPYGGQGSVYGDDRPDPALNANNNSAQYSMTAYYDAHVVGHEIGHNIGAVQNSAPHSSGGFHCHDGNDLMCYADGGSYFQSGGTMTYPCATSSGSLVDCGQDDYYHPGTPPAGSYLATHWNTADSGYLSPLQGTTSTAPSAPTALSTSADPASASVTVTWQPPASDGGSAITEYQVGRDGKDSGGSGPASVTLSPTARSHTFSALVPGSTYTLSVRAVNAVGTGAAATASVTLPAGGTRFEEAATEVAYENWKGLADQAASGGAHRVASAAGSSAQFAFTGTSVQWLTSVGPGRGKAQVLVDGVSKGTIDLYAASAGPRAYTFSGLALQAHKLDVKVTGPPSAAATGTAVAVDGFRVGTTTSEESARTVTYNTWRSVSSSRASGGAYRASGSSAAVATFTFSGTGVDWVTAQGPGWGRARIFLDGVDKGVVDLFATTARWQVARSYTGLPRGTHTITVDVLGTKTASASSTKVALDGFIVRP